MWLSVSLAEIELIDCPFRLKSLDFSCQPHPHPQIPCDLLCSCPVDSTVTHYSAPRRFRRFSFDTFQFSGDYGSFVYLHCNLVVCNASKPNSRCSVDCASLQFPRKRRDIEDDKDEVRAGLTEGPFILRREPDEEWRYDYTKKGTHITKYFRITIAGTPVRQQAGRDGAVVRVLASGFLQNTSMWLLVRFMLVLVLDPRGRFISGHSKPKIFKFQCNPDSTKPAEFPYSLYLVLCPSPWLPLRPVLYFFQSWTKA